MKALTTVFAASALALLGACSSGSQNEPSQISNFEIDEIIKTATQSYQAAGATDSLDDWSARATISTSIQWPVKLGNANLAALQDTIIARAFGSTAASRGIDEAITAFLGNTDLFETGLKYEKVDSLSVQGLTLEVTARILDLNTRIVTYQVMTSSFTGGAHPNTGISPFTYDLQQGKVLTAKDMFVAGSEPKLLEAIKQSLANELNTTPDKLEDAGIFASQLTTIGSPYINGDAIVFHYNPYEIAPYSMGMIDVNVWGAEIQDLLTPEVRALLD